MVGPGKMLRKEQRLKAAPRSPGPVTKIELTANFHGKYRVASAFVSVGRHRFIIESWTQPSRKLDRQAFQRRI